MITINYTIELLSDWHVSSGLSGGANTDSIVLKDDNGLPYIPGKTIKGLLREALEEINELQENKCSKADINKLFGEKKEDDKTTEENDFGTDSHFSNATLPQNEQNEIITNKLNSYLYRNLSSTTINEKGLAKNKSLRAMEVCMPLTLESKITDISEVEKELLKMAMQWTRRLGMKRNRGFGKCIFNLKEQN